LRALASALIAAWQEWSPAGPDALAASLLVTVGGRSAPILSSTCSAR
jgi:hypothetical protein